MHEIAMECYQSAFKKAGVKKMDLEDPVTRKLIFDMINNQDAYKPNQEGAKLIAERKERKRQKKANQVPGEDEEEKTAPHTPSGPPPPPPMPG